MLLGVSYQLSVISYQLSDVSFQLLASCMSACPYK